MSRATPDDQLKFLLNCVKHSNNGKIDFIEVAKECGIVSKGAAAKRYERLMKANGIYPNGGPSDKTAIPAAPREKLKTATAKAASAKKRKLDLPAADIKADKDDVVLMKAKTEPPDAHHIKSEPKSNEKTSLIVKPPISAIMPTPPPTAMQCSGPRPPQQLVRAPQTVYPYFRQYQHSMAHFPGPTMPPFLPPARPPPLPNTRYPMLRPSIPTQQDAPLNDTLIFEDFCTPELFEHRTFLEMPRVENSSHIPLPPQEMMMKDLLIEEKHTESPSGKTGPESILIID